MTKTTIEQKDVLGLIWNGFREAAGVDTISQN